METIKEVKVPQELITKEVTEFAHIADELTNLYAKKNNDYGDSFTKGMNIIGPFYGIGRLYDKMNRIITLTKNPEVAAVKEESVEDTLKDLACYSIMMLSYFRNKNIENLKQIVTE